MSDQARTDIEWIVGNSLRDVETAVFAATTAGVTDRTHTTRAAAVQQAAELNASGKRPWRGTEKVYRVTLDIREDNDRDAIDTLHDQIAAAIRAAVRVRPGPNALELGRQGKPFQLNYTESNQAADAVVGLVRFLTDRAEGTAP